MPLLEVGDLEIAFQEDKGEVLSIDQVSFRVEAGEIVCLVGESGSGKSVTSLGIMGLLGRGGKVVGGSVRFDGEDLLDKSEKEMDRIRGRSLAMIFQDALTSLNPVFTIGQQMIETMKVHLKLNRKEAARRAIGLLKKVGLPDPHDIMKKYPHTLSGGMRQRVMIAMALACDPKLLIADEPTTALDVTIQAQIMQLLKGLNKELHMSIVLITHDMGLVAEMADRVLVMYAGQIVEEADVFTLFQEPQHPYTRALLQSIPSIRDEQDRELASIPGSVPERYDELEGCRFANRCPYVSRECGKEQELRSREGGHPVRCWRQGILPASGYQDK